MKYSPVSLACFFLAACFVAYAGQCIAQSPDKTPEAPSTQRWRTLFDGKSLDGWKANLTPDSFQVKEGVLRIQATGKQKAHLFYEGAGKLFRDFELQATVRAEPDSNSGIFFHTDKSTRDRHKHLATGYEVQLNSATKEARKTGSLYAIVDLHKSPVNEQEWFDVTIKVVGKHITVKINDKLVVDYTEPENPARPPARKGRVLSPTGGLIALQAHDPGSVWYFREIRIRRL